MSSPEFDPSYAAGPAGPATTGPGGGPAIVKPLKHAAPVPKEDKRVRMGPNGGVIDLPAAGLRITVPKGALLSTVEIRVKTTDDEDIAYEFEPHGLVFLKPLVFSQDLKNTPLDGIKNIGSLRGAYFRDVTQLIPGVGAVVNEVIATRLEKNRLEFDIWHFSGYMMSTGRMGTDPDSDF